MLDYLRYVCAAESLAAIEASLIRNGYRIELPRQRSVGGASALVMSQGLASILLTDDPTTNIAVIEIWGAPRSAAAHFLESLPIDLTKESSCYRSTGSARSIS